MRTHIGAAAAIAVIILTTGPSAAQTGTTDANGCRVVKRSEIGAGNPSGPASASAMGSTVTAGGGTVSGQTTMGTTGSSVSAKDGRVTTTNTVNDQTTSTITPGAGASASSSSSNGNRTVISSTDGGCTVIMEKE